MLLLLGSAAAVAAPGLRALVLALDGAFLLGLALDFFLTPAPEVLAVERRVPERVRLSAQFERRLALAGPRGGLFVEVHEEFPAPFHVVGRTAAERRERRGETRRVRRVAGAPPALDPPAALDPSGGPDRGVLDASGKLELVRAYRSDRRGVYALGDLRLRVRGRLGLIERQGRFAGRQELAVEPALARLSETLQLAASDRWQDLGVRSLRRHGGMSEFESLREYVTGDEVRRVDWKAFARRAKPMVKSYQVERGQELFLLVDAGRRMRAVVEDGLHRGWSKLDWALDAALEIAAVALTKGDRVGAAAFQRQLAAYVPPARGSRALARLSSALFALQPSEEEADLGRALRELAVRHRRRAMVIVVSDVADPFSLDEQRAALASVSRRHSLIFAALDDPALRAAALGAGDVVERAAALELVAERARSLRVLAKSGARVLDALPAEAAAPMLAAWLDERRGG